MVVANKTNKTTLQRSTRRTLLKKGLTGPTLLEMSDKSVYQDLGIRPMSQTPFLDSLRIARYPTGPIEPTSLQTFSVHFIQNCSYFAQFREFAAPEPSRPIPQQHRLHQHAYNQQRNPLLRMSLHVLPND